MTPPATRDWHAVAVTKLAAVLGAGQGEYALKEAMRAAQLQHIASAADLHRVAQALSAMGGFAGAVGGLLSVHAVLYGANEGSDETTSRAGE